MSCQGEGHVTVSAHSITRNVSEILGRMRALYHTFIHTTRNGSGGAGEGSARAPGVAWAGSRRWRWTRGA